MAADKEPVYRYDFYIRFKDGHDIEVKDAEDYDIDTGLNWIHIANADEKRLVRLAETEDITIIRREVDANDKRKA